MPGYKIHDRSRVFPRFFCAKCSLVLREPMKLSCGHRLCHSCINQNQDSEQSTTDALQIICIQCQHVTLNSQIISDSNIEREIRSLIIKCTSCDWTDAISHYQIHLEQCHNQCHLSTHSKQTTDCPLKPFGCYQQFDSNDLSTHYYSWQHQRAIGQAAEHMSTEIDSMTSDENTSDLIQIFKDIFNKHQEYLTGFAHDSETRKTEINELVNSYDSTNSSITQHNIIIEAISLNHDLLFFEATSLKNRLDDETFVSHDGSFIWKITGCKEKFMDAQSERQTSIYSPPFYSSPTGYKMRARSYLHGDGNARGTHMSLFFVLMRGEHDAMLKFPFSYKVTFCLYDQTPQQRHIVDSFRPDVKSNSFQRPRSEMNIASGIPKFYSLDIIDPNGCAYVQNDTMLIRIIVDFGNIPKSLIPFMINLDPGLPSAVQQNMIDEEQNRLVSTNNITPKSS